MLIGENKRRISHNLIISKYFEEENTEIQNQYFIRNVGDELSIISLGFGDFFVVINPCSFDIEYDSNTFSNIIEMNLVEVEKFVAKAATVIRLFNQTEMPVFDFEAMKENLSTEAERKEIDHAVSEITGINDQYGIEQGSLGTSFDSIELNVDSLEAANYTHIEPDPEPAEVIEAQNLDEEIEKRKQELEAIEEKLAVKEQKLVEKIESNMQDIEKMDEELAAFEEELDSIDEYFDVDTLFDNLGLADPEEKTEIEESSKDSEEKKDSADKGSKQESKEVKKQSKDTVDKDSKQESKEVKQEKAKDVKAETKESKTAKKEIKKSKQGSNKKKK